MALTGTPLPGPLPCGDLVTIVTYLEMLDNPGAPVPPSPLSLLAIEKPDPDEYRSLFRLVGARWLWFSRLSMDDEKLCSIIHDPKVEVYTVTDGDGAKAGMAELDFRQTGQCELSFLGLIPELAGKGHGRWLLAQVLGHAWAPGVERVHVHTCTLDHPAALRTYLRAGFTPVQREIERFPDPRLLGILPIGCAPQLPLLGTVTSKDPRPAS
jgi:GNAT superfamily N-acetyltransferase